MRNKLDELQKYQKEVNKRVDDFKHEIENKESEIAKVNKEFSKAFISGEKTDTKKINKLKDELEDLKVQYDLIVKAIEEDDKMKELSMEVYKEHYGHKEHIDSIRSEHMKGINDKQKELDLLKANMDKAIIKVKQEQHNSKVERFEFIEYMNLDRSARDNFSQDTIGLSYKIYKEREMARQGKTTEEINDFRLKDFNKFVK